MKTSIVIFNDRKVPMNLQIQDVETIKEENHEQRFVQLKPLEMRRFDLDLPEGTIPFFKVWETGQALLSYVDSDIQF